MQKQPDKRLSKQSPIISLWLTLKIIDEAKRIIYRKRLPARSFTQYLIRTLYGGAVALTTTMNDTGGTSRNVPYNDWIRMDGPAANALYGIVVGTGTAAVAITDYKLQTQIAHGNAATQLYYQAQVVNIPVVAAPDIYFTLQRNFNNNSGADITIQEVGIYTKGSSSALYFCFVRDLTGALLVPNGKTFVAQYTIKTTV